MSKKISYILMLFVVGIVAILLSPPSEPVLKDDSLKKQIVGCSYEEIEKSIAELRSQAVESAGKSIGKGFWTQLKEYININMKAKDTLDKSLILIDNVINQECSN